GKDAVFTVTVNYILEDEETVPEYTDDFVEEYTDGEYTTTADYDEYIWEQVKATAEQDTDDGVSSAIESQVYANCTVSDTLPEGLVDYYAEVYMATQEEYASYYGMDLDTFIQNYYGYESADAYKEAMVEELTSSYVPQMLIREAIVQDMGLELTDEMVDAFMLDYIEYYGYSDVDEFLSAYGYEDVDSFITEIGEEDFNDAALNLEMWNQIKAAANITYVSESDASGDAE
nr:hypothetical protein [Eubacterium sp.]